MNPNDKQVAGNHYVGLYQHWDFVHDAGLTYLQAQATRYLCRYRKKNGREDLAKLRHYLEKIREEKSKLRTTAEEFAQSAELNRHEEYLLDAICRGSVDNALIWLDVLDSEYVDEAEAGPGYVNQD